MTAPTTPVCRAVGDIRIDTYRNGVGGWWMTVTHIPTGRTAEAHGTTTSEWFRVQDELVRQVKGDK